MYPGWYFYSLAWPFRGRKRPELRRPQALGVETEKQDKMLSERKKSMFWGVPYGARGASFFESWKMFFFPPLSHQNPLGRWACGMCLSRTSKKRRWKWEMWVVVIFAPRKSHVFPSFFCIDASLCPPQGYLIEMPRWLVPKAFKWCPRLSPSKRVVSCVVLLQIWMEMETDMSINLTHFCHIQDAIQEVKVVKPQAQCYESNRFSRHQCHRLDNVLFQCLWKLRPLLSCSSEIVQLPQEAL